MEVENQLRIPAELLSYFRVIWEVRDTLDSPIDHHYVVELAPHLEMPSTESWQYALEAIRLFHALRQFMDAALAEEGLIAILTKSERRDALGVEQLAIVLALCDFYDVRELVEPSLRALNRRQREVVVHPIGWAPQSAEELALPTEHEWRHGMRQWLLRRLHSLDIVARVTATWPRIGPLVACGVDHTLFLCEDRVWGCGLRDHGVLGALDHIQQRRLAAPVPLQTPRDVVAIACGGHHSALVTARGKLWVCGGNETGQLGLGDRNTREAWTEVPALPPVLQVVCGHQFTVARTLDGLWVCGEINHANPNHQLGLPKIFFSKKRWKRLPVTPQMGVVLEVACASNAIVVRTSVDVWGFGNNDEGQDDTETIHFFRLGLEDVRRIACGGDAAYALRSDGRLYAWGSVTLGGRRTIDTPTLLTAEDVHNILVMDVICGHDHVFILGYKGKGVTHLVRSGSDMKGQIQAANATSGNTIYRIYAGYSTSFVLSTDGLHASGRNTNCQLGIDQPPQEAVRTKGGERVAIRMRGLPERPAKKVASEELDQERVQKKRALGLLCACCDQEARAIETRFNRYKFCGPDCLGTFFGRRGTTCL